MTDRLFAPGHPDSGLAWHPREAAYSGRLEPRAVFHETERRWTLAWNRHGLTVSHLRRSWCSPGADFGVAGRPNRGIFAAAIGVGALGMIAASAIASPAFPPPPAYALSIDVPAPSPQQQQATSRAHEPKKRAARRAAATPVSARQAAPNIWSGDDERAHAAMTMDQTRATARALSSGELQSWNDPDGGVRGFVVAGPIDRSTGQACRDISILVRSSAGDRVTNDRRCART